MEFENLQLEVEHLPDFKSVDLTPIQKRYKNIIWINQGLVFLILWAIPVLAYYLLNLPLWIPATAFSVLLIIFIIRTIETEKGFPLKQFGIRQHDILYQSGFFYFTETLIPYNRIQHIEIKQGPLSRLFSLYALHIYTAGASSGDLVINGLDKNTAEKLKAKVLDKTTVLDE
jgi:membrane protein YdbS with pleckstrin-like domain